MAYETYQQVTGTIQSITRGNSCCTMTLSVVSGEEIINVIVTGETRIIDNVRLRRGMRIAAFYDAELPTPAVYPPQYRAELVTSLRNGQNVALDFFDGNLVSYDNTLQLTISPLATIETLNGQRYLCSPGNAELLVYYTTSTFSIPAQTTPQKIIVLCTE